jgi:hypothetical protein
MARRGYVWAKALAPERKAEVTAACERLIAEMTARYLPATRPPGYNRAVEIRGRWRGEAYTFLVRFVADAPDAVRPEFHAPFARIEHFNDRFAVSWMRHTGRWWPLRHSLTLEEAIAYVATEPVLRPPI